MNIIIAGPYEQADWLCEYFAVNYGPCAYACENN